MAKTKKRRQDERRFVHEMRNKIADEIVERTGIEAFGLDLKHLCDLLDYYMKATEFGREPKDGMKLVRSYMNSKLCEIEKDTPPCCDPSTELYWSM